MNNEPLDNWGEEDDVNSSSAPPIVMQHIMETDCWIYRLAIIGVVLFVLFCLGSIVYLASNDKDYESIIVVLATAVGGLVGLFVRKSS